MLGRKILDEYIRGQLDVAYQRDGLEGLVRRAKRYEAYNALLQTIFAVMYDINLLKAYLVTHDDLFAHALKGSLAMQTMLLIYNVHEKVEDMMDDKELEDTIEDVKKMVEKDGGTLESAVIHTHPIKKPWEESLRNLGRKVYMGIGGIIQPLFYEYVFQGMGLITKFENLVYKITGKAVDFGGTTPQATDAMVDMGSAFVNYHVLSLGADFKTAVWDIAQEVAESHGHKVRIRDYAEVVIKDKNGKRKKILFKDSN